MTIGIITFHRANNYGAVLQTFALQEVCNQFGATTSIIDYRNDIIESAYRLKPLPKLGNNIFNWKKRIDSWKYENRIFDKRNESFNEFRERNLFMTESISSGEERDMLGDQFDIVITGSDQIWNPLITNGFDKWYCFQSNNNSSVVASYAASVGNIDSFKTYSKSLTDIFSSYNYISLREVDAVDLFKQAFPDKNIYLCSDPTLLLQKKDWLKFVSKSNPIGEPFILYYDAAMNSEAEAIAIQTAKKYKKKLVHFNTSLRNNKDYIYAGEKGPDQFVNLFYHADFVISSSFHGTVFSIIFNKKFISVDHPVLGGRIVNLLTSLHLTDRIRNTFPSDDDKIWYSPDYSLVESYLSHITSSSFDYLKMIIEKSSRG